MMTRKTRQSKQVHNLVISMQFIAKSAYTLQLA